MEESNIFEEVNSYKDIKNVIEENLTIIYKNIYDQQLLETGLKAVKKISSKEEKRLVAIAHLIDKYYNNKDIKGNNARKKVPVLLLSILYLDKFYEDIKLYSNAEIILLSGYAMIGDLRSMARYKDLFSRNLLNYVHNKTNNYIEKEELLEIIEHKYVYNSELEQFNKKMIEFVINLTKEEFIIEKRQIERNISIIAERERFRI